MAKGVLTATDAQTAFIAGPRCRGRCGDGLCGSALESSAERGCLIPRRGRVLPGSGDVNGTVEGSHVCGTVGWLVMRTDLLLGPKSRRRGGKQRTSAVALVVEQNVSVEFELVGVASGVELVALPGGIEMSLLGWAPKGGLGVAEGGSGDRRGVDSALTVAVCGEGVGGVGERRRRL